MKIFAKEYGIFPGNEVAEKLNAMLAELKSIEGEKELVFEKGEYFLDVNKCPREHLHITNTIRETAYDPTDEKWLIVMGIYLRDVKDLVFDGGGSTFIVDGYATNMAVVDCENIVFKNFTIKSKKPRIYKMRIKSRSLFSATLEFAEDAAVETDGKRLIIGDKEYNLFMERGKTPGYLEVNVDDDRYPTHYQRWGNPIKNAYSFEKTGENTIVARGFFNMRLMNTNFGYYYFDGRRKQVGFFIGRTKNISYYNVEQNYSPSLALVAQDTENIYLEKLRFAPEKGSYLQSFSVADHLHICCCRGQITVKDSFFSSANDDVINVHGIHFKIEEITGRSMKVRFMHPEAYGFNIFHKGDELAIIDRKSLLEKAKGKVESFELIDNYTIKLELEEPISEKYVGNVVENISACPSLLFEGNSSERVSTRSILVTTRGKVEIRNNDFIYGKMKILEISDDALTWYESGMVKDVTFENNRIRECETQSISVLPCNTSYGGHVHSNVMIKNNIFEKCAQPVYVLKCVSNMNLVSNSYKFRRKKYLPMIINLGQVDIAKKDY